MTPQAVAAALRRRGLPAELVAAKPATGLAVSRDAGAGDAEASPPEAVGVSCACPPAQLTATLTAARDELGFDLLSALTAIDEDDHLRLLYHLVRVGVAQGGDVEHRGFLLLTVRAARGDHPDGPVVPSAVAVYPGANLQEREIFDLMGVRFRGHPNLTRVLTWTGFSGHPLRKDYVAVDEEIPWRLAGLAGPDGRLLTAEEARRAEEERDAWEPVAADAPLAQEPAGDGGESSS